MKDSEMFHISSFYASEVKDTFIIQIVMVLKILISSPPAGRVSENKWSEPTLVVSARLGRYIS